MFNSELCCIIYNKYSRQDVVVENDDDPEDEQEVTGKENHTPRIDISIQITESLLIEMSDKNWKTRNEGLIKLQGKFFEVIFTRQNHQSHLLNTKYLISYTN